MNLPKDGEKLTQGQVNLAINLDKFPNSKPGSKNWHYGQFEPWAMQFGYKDGIPIYASVDPNGYHIYFLNDGHKVPIILKIGETPATYGIKPK